MTGHDTLFIGGGWVSPSSAARIAVRNASTEEPIGETPEAAEADVDNNSTIAQEEIFGPVLSVIEYADTDDAIRIANDSDYGLGGVGVDHRSGPRQGRHPAGAHRHHGHQRLPAGPGRPVGRRQVQRHRP